jgi:asparagine synthase (glutamine-hydrolysing)
MVEGLTEKEARCMILTHPYLVQGRECYDRIASAAAIEPRDPFADRRVLEFLLSVPAKHLESDGWPKRLLRQAMAGYVTDAIRWRRGKEHLGWEFNKRFFEVCEYPYSHVDDLMLRLKGVVDEDKARKALGSLGSDEQLERFFYLRYFATWADRQKINGLTE